jgi:integrase family protein with SAM-like domain
VSAWLTGLRSARTRRAYAGDVAAWLGWLAGREADALAAGRVRVDLWAATQLDAGLAASTRHQRRPRGLACLGRYPWRSSPAGACAVILEKRAARWAR